MDRMTNIDALINRHLAQLARVLDPERPIAERRKALATIMRTMDKDFQS